VTSEPADPGGLGRIDDAVEELRHATYGLFGPALRARLFEQLGWEWSPIHYRALRIVEGTDPLRPTVGELAAALMVDKARATRLVGQLREAGLVTSAVGRLDRRRREVELTGAGRDLLAEARRIRLDFFADALNGWDAADIEALGVLIERFNASIRETGW
jgi:DNA-binding MarR family transcriptional regulator